MLPAGDEPAKQTETLPALSDSGDAVRNPAQVSFWLLEPAADAAMTYFYGQVFAIDTVQLLSLRSGYTFRQPGTQVPSWVTV